MREIRPIKQTLAPTPTGQEFDNLLDACCVTIENGFKAFGKLHSDLTLRSGQHSTCLTDGETPWHAEGMSKGVRSWIIEGTLRSEDELTPVLNAFLSDQAKRVRLRQIPPDWKFDCDALIIMGSRFGLQLPRTFEELTAKRAADEVARQQQIAQRKADEADKDRLYKLTPEYVEKQRLAKIESDKWEKEQWKDNLVRNIVDVIEPPPIFKDRENPTHDENVYAYCVRENRKELKRGFKALIDRTSFAPSTMLRIWREAEEEYTELLEDAEALPNSDEVIEKLINPKEFAARRIMDTFKEKAQGWEPSELPELLDGERRLLFDDYKAAVAFMFGEEKLFDTNAISIMLGLDRRWAVDIVAKDKYPTNPVDVTAGGVA